MRLNSGVRYVSFTYWYAINGGAYWMKRAPRIMQRISDREAYDIYNMNMMGGEPYYFNHDEGIV